MNATQEAISDAIGRGWKVTFAKGRLSSLVITAEKLHDGKRFVAKETLAPGAEADSWLVAERIQFATDERRLPPTEGQRLVYALSERKRLDPDAPDFIALSAQ